MRLQMKEVTISELWRNPSAIFRRVERRREPVGIIRRGIVIAEIVPCASAKPRKQARSNTRTSGEGNKIIGG
jgi:antitoxin (DNA-binding transcriptional repressor) of toxin-antitoxin stability system